MGKDLVFTETVITSVEPKRVMRFADECLLEIRLVDIKKNAAAWLYEYEVKGQSGRIEKFLIRIKNIEIED
jgi:hypothetical protein